MTEPPVAEVRPRSSKLHQYFGGSSLWLLTLLCLLIAAGLIWWSTPSRGTTVSIRFPEGHGLQPEDTVRYRGIEVGTVESVELDHSLGGVEVEVLLKPSATQLATEGTRFWIVRPELSLTRISGLETAIGHKYIGVSPGTAKESSPATYEFQGLADVPVDTLSDSGIELILRGDKRYSVSKGSTVTFRGVDVGTVLDVALSKEARHVDVRVRIFDQFSDLLTSETKFWATSGLDLDFSFGFNGGFNLDTESLETLARGGVSMITAGQGKPVAPGDVFTLHASAEDDWIEKASKFQTTSVNLRGAVPVSTSWSSPGLIFGKSQNSSRCNGVAIFDREPNPNQTPLFVLFPADVIEEKKIEDSFKLEINGKEVSPDSLADLGNGLIRVPAQGILNGFKLGSEVSPADQIVDCLAVRRGMDQDSFFHLSIDATSIKADADDANRWNVIDFNGDRKVWHGAPVVSAAEGKLIGVLLIHRRQTHILTLEGLRLNIQP